MSKLDEYYALKKKEKEINNKADKIAMLLIEEQLIKIFKNSRIKKELCLDEYNIRWGELNIKTRSISPNHFYGSKIFNTGCGVDVEKYVKIYGKITDLLKIIKRFNIKVKIDKTEIVKQMIKTLIKSSSIKV